MVIGLTGMVADMVIGRSGVVVDTGPGPLPAAAWLIGVLILGASVLALLLRRSRPSAAPTPGARRHLLANELVRAVRARGLGYLRAAGAGLRGGSESGTGGGAVSRTAGRASRRSTHARTAGRAAIKCPKPTRSNTVTNGA